jgi:hypothetical protein
LDGNYPVVSGLSDGDLFGRILIFQAVDLRGLPLKIRPVSHSTEPNSWMLSESVGKAGPDHSRMANDLAVGPSMTRYLKRFELFVAVNRIEMKFGGHLRWKWVKGES